MNRTPAEWAKVDADAVVAGSTAQARNVLKLALEDIASLTAPRGRIERIQQRADNDCGVAALAMACGVPYEQVEPLLSQGSGRGINETDVYDWLIENGWTWQLVYKNRRTAQTTYQKREPWPPKAFAPAHIIQVRATRDWHFTVMDGRGEVFDPWTADRKSLDHPDYQDISWVMGLWRVSGATAA